MENTQAEKVAKEVQKEEEDEEPANFFEIFDAEHQYDHTTFIFDGKEIKIESLGDFVQNTHLLGQMVWPNAQILGHWTVLNKDLFKDKTVLELGAGPGLNGILASVYCKRVVMTDYHDKVVDLLQRNIQLNSHLGTDMQAAKLTWGEGVVEFNQQYGPFDIIIGSGCVHESECIPLLLATAHYLLPVNDTDYNEDDLSKNEGGRLVLSTNNYRYERRKEQFEGITQKLGLRQQFMDMPKLLAFAEQEKAKDPRVAVQTDEFDLIHVCTLSRPSTAVPPTIGSSAPPS